MLSSLRGNKSPNDLKWMKRTQHRQISLETGLASETIGASFWSNESLFAGYRKVHVVVFKRC